MFIGLDLKKWSSWALGFLRISERLLIWPCYRGVPLGSNGKRSRVYGPVWWFHDQMAIGRDPSQEPKPGYHGMGKTVASPSWPIRSGI